LSLFQRSQPPLANATPSEEETTAIRNGDLLIPCRGVASDILGRNRPLLSDTVEFFLDRLTSDFASNTLPQSTRLTVPRVRFATPNARNALVASDLEPALKRLNLEVIDKDRLLYVLIFTYETHSLEDFLSVHMGFANPNIKTFLLKAWSVFEAQNALGWLFGSTRSCTFRTLIQRAIKLLKDEGWLSEQNPVAVYENIFRADFAVWKVLPPDYPRQGLASAQEYATRHNISLAEATAVPRMKLFLPNSSPRNDLINTLPDHSLSAAGLDTSSKRRNPSKRIIEEGFKVIKSVSKSADCQSPLYRKMKNAGLFSFSITRVSVSLS
jgi:hypothetical protein